MKKSKTQILKSNANIESLVTKIQKIFDFLWMTEKLNKKQIKYKR